MAIRSTSCTALMYLEAGLEAARALKYVLTGRNWILLLPELQQRRLCSCPGSRHLQRRVKFNK